MAIDLSTLAPAPTPTSIPVGTIVAFGGSRIPPGWLHCDGSQIVLNANSQDLYAAIGTSWGGPGNNAPDPTSFCLPDLRGYFLRGLDALGGGNGSPAPGSVDKDVNQRGFSRPDLLVSEQGNAGALTGSFQDYAFIGTFSYVVPGGGNTVEALVPGGGGGSEIRPKNKAVLYIIKYQAG